MPSPSRGAVVPDPMLAVNAADGFAEARAAFRREELFLEDGRSFDAALEPWQREHVFAPLDERTADGTPRYRLLYAEMPRGHGKTTCSAAEALTELMLGGMSRRIYAAATDEDQAGLLHEAAAGFVRRNPRLQKALTIDRRRITRRKTGSYLQVIAADAGSAHGLTPELVLFDELAQLGRPEFWHAMYSAVAKKSHARIVVTTTPGYRKTSVCWQVREAARTIDGYYFWSAGERLAGWLDAAEYERQRQMLPPHVFARLQQGQWTEGEGAFITSDDLARCIVPGRSMRLRCTERARHTLVVDLGLVKDRTAAAIVHRTSTGVSLDLLRTWQGSPGSPVQITTEVEPFMAAALRDFPNLHVAMDPWNAKSTFERFERSHPGRVEPFGFSPARITDLTRNLYSLTHAGQLELYPDPDLERELLDVQLIERSYGVRIDHRSGQHDDRVVALGMAAYVAMQEPGGHVALTDENFFVVDAPMVSWDGRSVQRTPRQW